MPTLAPKTKKPARKAAAARSALPYGIARRPLPPAKATAADFAREKEFGSGADWGAIEAAHAARAL